MTTLDVRNFAHLDRVSIEFGDLTILVGAQGTGKSLCLQWLKAALDGRHVVRALRDSGHDVAPDMLVELIFGTGMGDSWVEGRTRVTFDGVAVTPRTLGRRGAREESAFYIPAHRAMLISDGWAAPFQKLSQDTPVVARIFSQNLFNRLSRPQAEDLFPLDRVLKSSVRDLIDEAVFHGGRVGIDQDRQRTKRLHLRYGASQLPFMTWTAGQREFTPLLLGLYDLLPPRKTGKHPAIGWAIIEEPEMGLHPQAVTVFMLLVLDLLWRGYRVVLSTHSPLVLTVAWALRRLREAGADWRAVCDGFGIDKDRQGLKAVAESALQKSLRTHVLTFGADGRVTSKDISSLDPGSEDDDVAGWGGLSGFGSRFGDVVRRAVNARGAA